MNIALLKKIKTSRQGLLATVMSTEGHTYKKKGEKALFEVDDPFPVHGNIGSGCVDQEILRKGKDAFTTQKPTTVRIDTSDPSDVVFGYGVFCGGIIEILLEPVFENQKTIYRELLSMLEERDHRLNKKPIYLAHDLDTGAITLTREKPRSRDGVFIERVHPPSNLYIFGATPLAHQITRFLEEMDFLIHIIDWRPGYLEKFEGVTHVRLHNECEITEESSLVLIFSHQFERDRDVLKQALLQRCAYIGLLSSPTRRDKIFDELEKEGVERSMFERISSPVGIDITSRSDPEIAVSIVAELIRFKNGACDPPH